MTTNELESVPSTEPSKLMRGKKDMGKTAATDKAASNVKPQLNMLMVTYKQSENRLPDF